MGKVKDLMMGDDMAMGNIVHVGNIDELKTVVVEHERSRPRSQQIQIGPSEAGNPCNRRLAYKLLGARGINTDSDPWASIVGTSVHAWLDTAFADANTRLGWDRWHTSIKIELPGYMRGTIDLYDEHTKTVIDHKVVGNTTLKKARSEGPSQQYIVQGQLYATGLRNAGYDVQHIAIAYWSRSGAMKDAYWWTMPYNETVSEQTLERLDALKHVTELIGRAALPNIPTAPDANCMWCPYYLPAITDVTEGCPGHR
ncbi:PD-(D/E)XK nuclease superfamily [uncultured Caudovirales phage]|uniref:PD-(D/E)XK nuclease superfamily n=1 Tax=uncultured Caudovirales phage TaxID=2100421 RepID=A0A6J7WL63_9CAUD|nr:PD-(D/E)XK nuclease superfamily [uncultured Caudovirales phage]